MVKELVGISREVSIDVIRGVRYRSVYEVKQFKVSTRRLTFKVYPRLTKDTLINRIGRPYTVVAGKGARFRSYEDAYVEMPTPIYRDIEYVDYKRRLVERKRVEEVKERMIRYVYTIRNKSKGESKKVRHIEATIEAYVDEGYPLWKIQKKLDDIVSKTDFAFILVNYDVEGEESRDVPLVAKDLYSYSFVLMDYDYRTVRHRESGSL